MTRDYNPYPDPESFIDQSVDKKQPPPSAQETGRTYHNTHAKLKHDMNELNRSLNPFVRDRGSGLIAANSGDEWMRKLLWTRLRTQVDCPFCGMRQTPAFREMPQVLAECLALPAYCRNDECAQGYDLFDQPIYDLAGNRLTSFPADISVSIL